MKKQILLIICVLSTLVSCSLSNEENIFDESSANRLTAELKLSKALLIGPKNGWLMEYYPAGTSTLVGGYNIFAAFSEDGNVTISSEIAGNEDKVESLYSLKQSAGPVLSFDSHNEIMHFFSDPLNGIGGDFEFTIMTASQDKIVLSGKRTNSIVVMTPVKEEVKWSDYLAEVKSIKEHAFLATYNLIINDVVVTLAEQNYNTLSFSYTSEDETIISKVIPFIYTPTGIKLMEPFTLNGVTMENFIYDDSDISFKCSDIGVSVKLVGVYPAGYKFYEEIEGSYKYGDTKTVQIIANDDNSTYTIKGLSTRYDIQARYVRKTGSISIQFQYLGVYSTYNMYLCPWDSVEGYLTWASGSGLDGVNNTTEPFTISFVDNGVYGSADSFLVYAFSGTPSSSTTVGTLERIPTPKLIKID